MRTAGMIGFSATCAALARNLLRYGFTVRGFDIRKDACEPAARHYACFSQFLVRFKVNHAVTNE